MAGRISILGIPIDAVTLSEATTRLRAFVTSNGQHHVMTPNPEMLVEAQRNSEFKELLQRTSLNLPDGTGLLWAAKRQSTPLPERVTGIDVLEEFSKNTDAPIFLLGAEPGVAEEAAKALSRKHPALMIAGTFAGSPNPEDQEELLKRINASGARVLFVAFGAPKQDLWIAKHLQRMPTVKLAMGVGGAFDFLAGKRKRAPAWIRSLHIEWLWRLMQEPSRIGRIWNAVVVFPWLILSNDRRADARR